MGLQIRVRHALGERVYDLPARRSDRPVVVGRAAACDVKVPSAEAAAQHCALFVHEGRWCIGVIDPMGATAVNGQPLEAPTFVQIGDVVTIGGGADFATIEIEPLAVAAGQRGYVPAAGVKPAAAMPMSPAPQRAAGPARPPQPRTVRHAPPGHAPIAPGYPAPAQGGFGPSAGEPIESDGDAVAMDMEAPSAFGYGSSGGSSFRSARRRPRKQSNAGMIAVVIGVAVALIGGVVLIAMNRSNEKPAVAKPTTTPASARGGQPDAGAPLKPATQPSTPTAAAQPATAPPVSPPAGANADGASATPYDAVMAFGRALETGNLESVKRVTIGEPIHYAHMTEALRFGRAARVLEDAAVARFGPAGHGISSPAAPLPTRFAGMEAPQVQVDGESATVSWPSDRATFKTRKLATGWKVDLVAQMPIPPEVKAAWKGETARMSALDGEIERLLLAGAVMVGTGQFEDAGAAMNLIQSGIGMAVQAHQAREAAAAQPAQVPPAIAGATPAPTPTLPVPTPATPAVTPATPAATSTPPVTATPVPVPAPVPPDLERLPPPTKRAAQIVFVCDIAGPGLAPHAESIKQEMQKAIDGMLPSQSIRIVVPAGLGEPAMASAPRSVPANAAGKETASKFVADLKPAKGGIRTDMVKAVETALAEKPELVYLLVGSDRTDGATFAKRIRELNADGRCRINPIFYAGPDDPAAEKREQTLIDTLRAVAKENGGVMNYVRAEEIEAMQKQP